MAACHSVFAPAICGGVGGGRGVGEVTAASEGLSGKQRKQVAMGGMETPSLFSTEIISILRNSGKKKDTIPV